MARFLFDVLNTTGRAWDEEAVECADRAAVEAHARALLAAGQPHHDGGMYPVTVTVLNAACALILIAALKPDGAVLKWNRPV